MVLLQLIYALIASSFFIILYLGNYKKFFELRKNYILGLILFMSSVFIQLIVVFIPNIQIGWIGILSFVTYPISILLIYKTNIFNILFLALNSILKIYIGFTFISALFANLQGVQFTSTWIYSSDYYLFAQGTAYLISIGSLILFDKIMLGDTLKDFFLLRRNLLIIISIQCILIINMIWITFTYQTLPATWYNNVLLLLSFSVEIIYFLLRLFTSRSSYFSSYKSHTETLKKQLEFQVEHYKTYESQTNEFLKFKHDYDKILKGITSLLASKDYDSIKKLVTESNTELDSIVINYKKYSNNVVLDALLNDYAKRYEASFIKFNSFAYIDFINMTEIKLLKLFYNILENSYEALIQVPDVNNRMFTITSEKVENYLKMSFVNTYSGNVQLDLNSTSKPDKVLHGFGNSIISEIVTSYDGFINRFTTIINDVSYYHLEIFLPLS